MSSEIVPIISETNPVDSGLGGVIRVASNLTMDQIEGNMQFWDDIADQPVSQDRKKQREQHRKLLEMGELLGL